MENKITIHLMCGAFSQLLAEQNSDILWWVHVRELYQNRYQEILPENWIKSVDQNKSGIRLENPCQDRWTVRLAQQVIGRATCMLCLRLPVYLFFFVRSTSFPHLNFLPFIFQLLCELSFSGFGELSQRIVFLDMSRCYARTGKYLQESKDMLCTFYQEWRAASHLSKISFLLD